MNGLGARLGRCMLGVEDLGSRCVALPLLLALVACGDAPPDSDTGPGEPRSLRRAAARALPPEERRAPQTRSLEPRPGRERPVVAAVRAPPPPTPSARVSLPRPGPARIEDLTALEPAEVMRRLRELQGPLESAHYVLQRESRVEIEGEPPQAVEGGLSLVDCSWDDPDDPSRGQVLWVGGLRVEGVPELEGRIKTRRVMELYGREIHYSGRWKDARLLRDRLGGFARTLDAQLEAEDSDATRVWRRELIQDPAAPSRVVSYAEGEGCPVEITLNLVVEDRVEHWEPRLGEDGSVQPYRTALDTGDVVARATLVARWVAAEPEIIDPAQRAPRVRLRPAVAAGELPRHSVESPRVQGAGRVLEPEEPVFYRARLEER